MDVASAPQPSHVGTVGVMTAGSEAWTRSVFATLCGLLGTPKVNAIARRFQTDVQTRFAAPADRESVRRDAHAVTSTAGMLGFGVLSAAARTAETACARGDDITPYVSDLMQARKTVIELLTLHLDQG